MSTPIETYVVLMEICSEAMCVYTVPDVFFSKLGQCVNATETVIDLVDLSQAFPENTTVEIYSECLTEKELEDVQRRPTPDPTLDSLQRDGLSDIGQKREPLREDKPNGF